MLLLYDEPIFRHTLDKEIYEALEVPHPNSDHGIIYCRMTSQTYDDVILNTKKRSAMMTSFVLFPYFNRR